MNRIKILNSDITKLEVDAIVNRHRKIADANEVSGFSRSEK